MEDSSKAFPFPVREFRTAASITVPRSFIPQWMADFVYAQWTKVHGHNVPIEHFKEQGGFEAGLVLDLIAGGDGSGTALKRAMRSTQTEKSIKGEVEILVPGTKAYMDAMREMSDHAKSAQKKAESNLGATGQRLKFGYNGR
jgi:hypothetical protein